jgi:hypothetical protein
MEGEQTWPTEEELAEAEDESRVLKRRIKKIPKGMSDYQAAWIPDTDAGEGVCCVQYDLIVMIIYEISESFHCSRYFPHMQMAEIYNLKHVSLLLTLCGTSLKILMWVVQFVLFLVHL